MAGDLIPPPSPAGRPEAAGLRRATDDDAPLWAAGDGGGVREEAGEPVVAAPAPEPSPLARYRSRFGFILGALAGTGVAALVVTALVVLGGGGNGSGGDGDTWSRWHPTADAFLERAAQIGAHVGPRYRDDDGSQIVAVQAGPIAFRDEVPAEVVIRTKATAGDIVPIEGKGVLYTLNGLGPNGSISIGEKSPERLALLKQAAVETALYSFHYTDADHVAVVLPPAPPSPGVSRGPTGTTGAAGAVATRPADVLFFRRADLSRQLVQPLQATVPDRVPPPQTLTAADVKAITLQTTPLDFVANFQQPADGRVYFVLERRESLNTKGLGKSSP